MKKVFAILLGLLVILAALPSLADAQSSQAPGNLQVGYSYNVPVAGYPDSTSVKAYASRIDTLYERYWINRSTGAYQTPTYYKLGFFNRVSVSIDASDSSSTDVIIKYRHRSRGYGAAGSWVTALDDSAVAVANGIVKEFALVDNDSDLFDALDVEIIIILTTNAHDIEVTNAATLRRRVRLNFVQ